jgi:translocation and assembly module TamB
MVFSAEGALDLGAPGAECLLRNLLLTTNGTPLLELEKPARVVFRRQTEPLKRLVLNLEGIHLFGPGGEIETRAAIDWPDYGDVYVSIQKLNSGFVTNFVKNSGPEIEIRNLHTSANWSNGPAKVEIELSGAAAHFSCDLKLTGDEHGIIISNLMVSSATSLVATAYGFLPATFQPNARSNQLHFIPKVPLRLAATTQPDSLLWEALGNWTGLVLREPELNLNVSGTWSDPVGIIHLAARRIQFRRESKETPNLENLRLNVQLDKQQARIVECQLLVDRQPVNLTAQLPLGDQFWSRPDPRKFADWDKASARLRIENANLASFTHLVPDVLAPAGHLNLDMSLQPGAKLEGSLEIGSVRTRPLPNLGTIRDIQLKLKILQKDVVLESASAEVGGAIVHANGQADFRQFNWPDPQVPPFKFTLRGTNVPLSREPEVIVRSDLDLAVIKTNHDPAIVSGTVRLKNSIYLRDLADLVPGKVSEPEHRPPYFSIPTEPFAHWRVAVQVIGDKFLTVRTPLFNGRVSSNLRILGTLREPIALGDLKIDSGNVKFPFASLQVLQGLITLSSGDPYHPQLTISAGSRKFGYDVRMELSGPADSPLIQFSSTPPLSSEQLVLMLTAGELPKNELTLTPQQKAQTVGLFFGRDFLSKLGIGDEGEERLTIRSGEEISEHGTPTYTLEYKLSDRWTLVGEYDRFNDFNAGFKWRVYSK